MEFLDNGVEVGSDFAGLAENVAQFRLGQATFKVVVSGDGEGGACPLAFAWRRVRPGTGGSGERKQGGQFSTQGAQCPAAMPGNQAADDGSELALQDTGDGAGRTLRIALRVDLDFNLVAGDAAMQEARRHKDGTAVQFDKTEALFVYGESANEFNRMFFFLVHSRIFYR